MALTITTARSAPSAAKLVGVGVFTDDDRPKSLPKALLDSRGFDAKLGKTMIVETDKGLVAAIGLGAVDELTEHSLRKAGASFARAARRHKAVATTVLADAVSARKGGDPFDQALAAECLAEGLELGSYAFETYKSKSARNDLNKVTVAGSTSAAVKAGLTIGQAIAGGQMLARDFVNEPGGTLTPPEFARRVQRMAKTAGVT